MQSPKHVSNVRRFIGMVIHLGKSRGANRSATHLSVKENHSLWGSAQSDAFDKIRQILASTAVLAHYNPRPKPSFQPTHPLLVLSYKNDKADNFFQSSQREDAGRLS